MWLKVVIRLRAATGTPWQADTIFGHLCWVLAQRDGEAALHRFLEPFLAGSPSLLLSNGFPPGLLPHPLNFRLADDGTRDSFCANRELRRQVFLTEADFRRATQGETFKPVDPEEDHQKAGHSRAVLKNQINRLTGTTGEQGTLYGFTEHWIPEVVVYAKVREDSEDLVRTLFQVLTISGYGKRKAVGYGAIQSLDFGPFDGFPTPDGANGFVTLSAFVPSPIDPTDGRWRLRVKYGRLGEEFAFSNNPFKRPLVMFEPGSVFYDAPVKEHYGRMVAGLSATHPEVVHYGFALPVAMKLPETPASDPRP